MPEQSLTDRDAEEAVVGSMLLNVTAIETAGGLLELSDFAFPALGHVFAAIVGLYKRGEPIDLLTVMSSLAADGLSHVVGGKRTVMALTAAAPASANAYAYATRVIELADRRRLALTGANLHATASDQSVDIDTIRDATRADLDGLVRPGQSVTHADFATWAPGVTMGYDWIIPDVLESRDRLMLVASEGTGKSVVLRQWALQAACGVHWFRNERIPTKRALVIDVENSGRQIVRNTLPMYEFARQRFGGWKDEDFTIVPVGTTLDITGRADRLRVEKYLAGHRPDILVIGPLYKLMRMVRQQSSYEEQAAAVTEVLDGWRSRYGCALLIEHHAAKASGGHRSLDPLGSSMFLRWPEFVLTLEQDEQQTRYWNVGHARGQREFRSWPARMERTRNGWMWSAANDDDAPDQF